MKELTYKSVTGKIAVKVPNKWFKITDEMNKQEAAENKKFKGNNIQANEYYLYSN